MTQTENAKKWFFPPLNGGEFQGFSDSSTDNFKTTDNLGRESAQNSIGALRDGCKTVSMKYTLKTVDTNLFPGRENYLKRLTAARNFYSLQHTRRSFFESVSPEEEFRDPYHRSRNCLRSQ